MAAVIDTKVVPGWWPVDKIVVPYILGTCAFIIAIYPSVPDAGYLLVLHAVEIALVLLAIRHPENTAAVWFHHWYPIFYVSDCYREASILIHATHRPAADAALAHIDYAFWHANPTVWVERLYNPAFTEFLQIVYSLFVPAVLSISMVLWRQRRYEKFRYYGFLVAAGFLVSYVGYYLVPARGPRFELAHLQTQPLRGLFLFEPLQHLLDSLESAHYDCFPSGHTELSIIATLGARMISPGLFRLFAVYTGFIIFATVYLRYHYTVDLLAGAVVAAGLAVSMPYVYRWLQSGERGR